MENTPRYKAIRFTWAFMRRPCVQDVKRTKEMKYICIVSFHETDEEAEAEAKRLNEEWEEASKGE